MSRVMIALVISFVLTLGGVAQATELFTQPLEAQAENHLDCWIVNVSNGPKEVQIRVMDDDGEAVADTGTITLGPGKVHVRFVEGKTGARYCRFTVQGGKTNYRAGIAVFDPNGVGNVAAAPAE